MNIKKAERKIFLRLFGIFLLVLILGCMSGAKPPTPALNSEMIQSKYGNYSIKVVKSSPILRISDLYSSHNNVKTTRTLAVVIFPNIIDASVRAEHSLITEKSQSIGSTFKTNGWKVKKQNRYFGTLASVPPTVKKLMAISDATIAMHIYELLVEKDGKMLHYCTIAEIHHPDYLTVADLPHLYGEAAKTSDRSAISVDKILELVNTELKGIEGTI